MSNNFGSRFRVKTKCFCRHTCWRIGFIFELRIFFNRFYNLKTHSCRVKWTNLGRLWTCTFFNLIQLFIIVSVVVFVSLTLFAWINSWLLVKIVLPIVTIGFFFNFLNVSFVLCKSTDERNEQTIPTCRETIKLYSPTDLIAKYFCYFKVYIYTRGQNLFNISFLS